MRKNEFGNKLKMYLSHLKWDLYDFGSECFDLKKNKNRSTCGCCPDQWTCGGSSVTVAQNTLGLNSMSENCFFRMQGTDSIELNLDWMLPGETYRIWFLATFSGILSNV